MRSETYWVALDSIDSPDETFRVSASGPCPELARSIREVGLINPPVIQEKGEGRFRIISGFRRVQACRDLNSVRTEAKVADPLLPDLECAMLAVTDNASQRPLTLMEQARAIAMVGPDLAWEKRLPLIQTALLLPDPPNPRHLEQVESLLGLLPVIREGLEEESIAFPLALKLGALEESDARALARLFRSLGLSLSKQREVFTLAGEIAARENLSIQEVLEAPEIAQALAPEGMDQNLASRAVRDYLKKRRFPAITQAQEAFDQHVRDLDLPKEVSLAPPAHFEGLVYELKFSFKNINDLIKNQDVILNLAERPGLKKILAR